MHCEDDDDHDDVMRVITMVRVNGKASLRTAIYTACTAKKWNVYEMPHFALVTHCSTNYCSSEFALPSQPEKAILTIFYIITLNQAKKLTGGSSVLVYWAGGPPHPSIRCA